MTSASSLFCIMNVALLGTSLNATTAVRCSGLSHFYTKAPVSFITSPLGTKSYSKMHTMNKSNYSRNSFFFAAFMSFGFFMASSLDLDASEYQRSNAENSNLFTRRPLVQQLSAEEIRRSKLQRQVQENGRAAEARDMHTKPRERVSRLLEEHGLLKGAAFANASLHGSPVNHSSIDSALRKVDAAARALEERNRNQQRGGDVCGRTKQKTGGNPSLLAMQGGRPPVLPYLSTETRSSSSVPPVNPSHKGNVSQQRGEKVYRPGAIPSSLLAAKFVVQPQKQYYSPCRQASNNKSQLANGGYNPDLSSILISQSRSPSDQRLGRQPDRDRGLLPETILQLYLDHSIGMRKIELDCSNRILQIVLAFHEAKSGVLNIRLARKDAANRRLALEALAAQESEVRNVLILECKDHRSTIVAESGVLNILLAMQAEERERLKAENLRFALEAQESKVRNVLIEECTNDLLTIAFRSIAFSNTFINSRLAGRATSLTERDLQPLEDDNELVQTPRPFHTYSPCLPQAPFVKQGSSLTVTNLEKLAQGNDQSGIDTDFDQASVARSQGGMSAASGGTDLAFGAISSSINDTFPHLTVDEIKAFLSKFNRTLKDANHSAHCKKLNDEAEAKRNAADNALLEKRLSKSAQPGSK